MNPKRMMLLVAALCGLASARPAEACDRHSGGVPMVHGPRVDAALGKMMELVERPAGPAAVKIDPECLKKGSHCLLIYVERDGHGQWLSARDFRLARESHAMHQYTLEYFERMLDLDPGKDAPGMGAESRKRVEAALDGILETLRWGWTAPR